jgi:hypothetical protein
MDNNVYPALLSSVIIAAEKCLISSLRPLERKVRSTVDETQIECLLASTFLFRILLSSQYNLENVPEIVELPYQCGGYSAVRRSSREEG